MSFVASKSLALLVKSLPAMTNAALIEQYTMLCLERAEKRSEAEDFNFQVRQVLKAEILRRMGAVSVVQVACLQAADTIMFEFPTTAGMLREVAVASLKREGDKS